MSLSNIRIYKTKQNKTNMKSSTVLATMKSSTVIWQYKQWKIKLISLKTYPWREGIILIICL